MPPPSRYNGGRRGDAYRWTHMNGVGQVPTRPLPKRYTYLHGGASQSQSLTPPRIISANHPRLQVSSLSQGGYDTQARRRIQAPIRTDEYQSCERSQKRRNTSLTGYQENHSQSLSERIARQRERLSERAETQRHENIRPFLEKPESSPDRSSDMHIKKESPDDESVSLNGVQGIGPEDNADSQPPLDLGSPEVTEVIRCRCPIGEPCPTKTTELIDCRTLVLEKEWNKWLKKQGKEFPTALPPSTEPEDEAFMTLPEVEAVASILEKIGTMQGKSRAICNKFQRLQEWVRKAQSNSISPDVLQQSSALKCLEKFLSPDNAPNRLEKAVPISIVENLKIIYTKWQHGDLSVLARRGLVQSSGQSQYYPDSKWAYTRKADFFGHGHLVNGQTWRLRAEMSRDGAHAPLIAGIYGTVDLGAKSIVMGLHDEPKKEFYADIDQGTRIWYMGTGLDREEGDKEPTNIKDPNQHGSGMIHLNEKGADPTYSTKALITSYRTKRPVRVFRSFRLAPIVEHRPVKGFRYDGLYKVVAYELLKEYRQIYRFELIRLDETEDDQGPLRDNLPPPEPAKRKRPKQE